MNASPDGIDVERVTPWLVARVPTLRTPLRWTQLPGGHSNLTYRVDDAAGTAVVVRRPPKGKLLPTAHDMRREFEVISALWPTSVPVAEPLAYTDDRRVADADIYAMGWVSGRSLHYAADALEHLEGAPARESTGLSAVDTLASLHSLNPDEIGLGGLGSRTPYVHRQLRRWYESWEASKIQDSAVVDRLYQLLLDRMPQQGTVSVVHGDFGLHNCRITSAGRVAAVIDWEIATLGDPLADLAYFLNGWVQPGEEGPRANPPTAMPGFSDRAALIDRYADRTARDLSELEYYRCFNYWKSYCIRQGVYARYLRGQKSADGVDLTAMATAVERTLQLAVESADRLWV